MHELPLQELQELLAANYDEVTLLDALGVTSYDIVQRFADIIEDDQEKFMKMLDGIELYGDDDIS